MQPPPPVANPPNAYQPPTTNSAPAPFYPPATSNNNAYNPNGYQGNASYPQQTYDPYSQQPPAPPQGRSNGGGRPSLPPAVLEPGQPHAAVMTPMPAQPPMPAGMPPASGQQSMPTARPLNTLNPVTHAERDKLRGWNDVPQMSASQRSRQPTRKKTAPKVALANPFSTPAPANPAPPSHPTPASQANMSQAPQAMAPPPQPAQAQPAPVQVPPEAATLGAHVSRILEICRSGNAKGNARKMDDCEAKFNQFYSAVAAQNGDALNLVQSLEHLVALLATGRDDLALQQFRPLMQANLGKSQNTTIINNVKNMVNLVKTYKQKNRSWPQ